jgi:hypothetical protein
MINVVPTLIPILSVRSQDPGVVAPNTIAAILSGSANNNKQQPIQMTKAYFLAESLILQNDC